MSSIPAEILADRAKFDEWLHHNPAVRVDAHGVVAPGADLSGRSLRGAVFTAAHLSGCEFAHSDLQGAALNVAKLDGASFNGATIGGCDFEQAQLSGADLRSVREAGTARFKSARLTGVNARKADLSGATFLSAHFDRANLEQAMCDRACLKGVTFEGADLRGTSFRGATLTNSVWRGARINSQTNFDASIWRPEHDSPNDGSAELALIWWQKMLSWNTLRFMGQVPLFAGAYLLLTGTLLTVSSVAWFNAHQLSTVLRYPIPVPATARLLLAGSVLLAIGSTLYEFLCPAQVKEYSRVKWVNELGRPGVLHIADGLKRPLCVGLTMLLTATGGLIVSLVFLFRLVDALRYVVGAS